MTTNDEFSRAVCLTAKFVWNGCLPLLLGSIRNGRCSFRLVRTGEREQAIKFLRETRRMSRNVAAKRVVTIAAELGIG